MLTHHRLVGWWLAGASVVFTVPSYAQSTASFPEDPPRAPAAAPAPPRPAPTYVAPPPPAPAAAPPARPVTPLPAPAPAPAPAVRPLPPPAEPVAPLAAAPVAAAPGVDLRPPVLPYYKDYPIPPGYEVVKRPASGLIKGGLIGFGIAYVGAIGFAAVEGFDNGTAWLAVPLVGPWGAIGARNYEQCKTSTVAEAKRCVRNAVKEVQIITFVAVDGIGQLAGALVMLAGALSSKEELHRSDLLKVEVSVLPPMNGDPWALSVRGTF